MGLPGLNGAPGVPGLAGSKGLPVNKYYILINYNLFLFRVNQVHLETQVFQADEVNQAYRVNFIIDSIKINLIEMFLF